MASHHNPEFPASVIVPSYGREEQAFVLLDRLMEQCAPHRAELVLVDQSGYSPDRIRSVETRCDFQYIRLKRPNLPAARNAGASAARGQILLFIDDDCKPSPDWLSQHLASFEDGSVGCVGGAVFDSNAVGTSAHPVVYDPDNGKYLADFGCTIPQKTIAFPGGNCSMRRGVWRALKFDKAYKSNAYFEEVDFAFRASRLGWKIQYNPKAGIEHHKAPLGGCREEGRREAYYRFRNYALFHFRHGNIFRCPLFFVEEKRYAEYISRKENGGHRLSLVFAAMVGSALGSLIGLRKRWLK